MQLDERVSELGFNFPLTRSYRDGTSVSSLIQKTGEGKGGGGSSLTDKQKDTSYIPLCMNIRVIMKRKMS